MSKYYVVNANGQPTAVCAYPIPGLQCVPATPELDSAWAAVQADLPPRPPPPYEVSKYVILERLIARGKGVAFLSALAADPLTQARWDAANALDSDNPLLLAVRDQLIPALGLTPADADQILRPGREIP